MKLRQPASRRAAWTLWACALALLLKAAMPMLASASAHAQGRALIEVCTVYGVARVPPAAPDAAASAGLASGVMAAHPSWRWRPTATASPADACAAWVAQLRHGPPTRA